MIKTLRKSKGFTLVELLIVIIIIGILAGMMMLSSGSATDKAEATKIVSDLRNIKAACIMYYADNGSWPSADMDLNTTAGKDIYKYLDTIPAAGYKLYAATDTKSVGYGGVKLTASTGVQEKLAKMAADAGLYNALPTSADVPAAAYSSGAIVYMLIKK